MSKEQKDQKKPIEDPKKIALEKKKEEALIEKRRQKKREEKEKARKAANAQPFLDNVKVVHDLREEYKKCVRFWYSCDKPSKTEYKRLLMATGIGIIAIGAVGFVIKAISYPVFTAISKKAGKQ